MRCVKFILVPLGVIARLCGALIFSTLLLGQQTGERTERVYGFALSPVVLQDADCARDYAAAWQRGGLELRKALVDLKRFGCLWDSLRGVFEGESYDRANLAPKGSKSAVYFRRVKMSRDTNLTAMAAKGARVPVFPNAIEGWIADVDFLPLDREEVARRIQAGELKLVVR
jgi:hypothetical protein